MSNGEPNPGPNTGMIAAKRYIAGNVPHTSDGYNAITSGGTSLQEVDDLKGVKVIQKVK